jgi:hypothetical protein
LPANIAIKHAPASGEGEANPNTGSKRLACKGLPLKKYFTDFQKINENELPLCQITFNQFKLNHAKR